MSAFIILTMMNRSRGGHWPAHHSPDPAPQKPEPSKYDLALESIELREKHKRELRAEPIKMAREFRTKLNELASTEEVRFLRRALEIEGKEYQPIGEMLRYYKKGFMGHGTKNAVQLALTPSGFRLLDDYRYRMEEPGRYRVGQRWKWTSLLVKLCQDGMNIEKVESWVEKEVKRRLEENSTRAQRKKEEVVP